MKYDNHHESDLYPEGNQELAWLTADLRQLAQPYQAARINTEKDDAIRHALQTQVRQQNAQPQKRFWLATPQRRRLAFVATLVLAMLLIGGTVYAGLLPIDQATSSYPGTVKVKMQQVNLRASSCGYTVTIQRLYADANNVFVGYTIQAPAGRTFHGGFEFAADSKLTDSQGRIFPMTGGVGTNMLDNSTSDVRAFDAGLIRDNPASLHLHLNIPSILATEIVKNASQPSPACETYRTAKKDEVPESWDHTKTRWVTAHVALVFDFTVPFTHSNQLLLNQTITAGGTALTLERVVSTPSETRFYLPNGNMAISAELNVAGRTVTVGKMGLWPLNQKYLYVAFDTDQNNFYNQRGQWSLTITSRHDLANIAPGGALNGGPWTFTFKMP